MTSAEVNWCYHYRLVSKEDSVVVSGEGLLTMRRLAEAYCMEKVGP
jgi:hypothetical protein